MKKFKVIIYETVRHEVFLTAEDEGSARTAAGFIELGEDTEDHDYFETEIMDVEEFTDEENN